MKINSKRIDIKLIRDILIRENIFLNELFSVVPVPVREQEEEGEGK